MAKILLIEDDPALGWGLCVNLETEGFSVCWVKDLQTAKVKCDSEKNDLVILDLYLPDGDGISFLREIRASNSQIPVIILTARIDEDSVVDGLHAGANDYVRKPFGRRELVARIKTALKGLKQLEMQLQYDDLVILIEQRRAIYRDIDIVLNRREFNLLAFFVEHADKVVSREKLLATFNKDRELIDRTIDSHVSHVRARLRKAGVTSIQISPVYGIGYRLERIEKRLK